MLWFVLLLSYLKEIPVFNANGVNPDRTPRSAPDINGGFKVLLNKI